MPGFPWVDAAWNSLCGFCVREVFERKHEREKQKSPHCSSGELVQKASSFKVTELAGHKPQWGSRNEMY